MCRWSLWARPAHSQTHLRARHCNQCGAKLDEDRAIRDADGRAKLHADIAHPINSACREVIQSAILKAYREESERAKQPGYVCTYDDLDGAEFDEYTQVIGELIAPARPVTGEFRTHPAHGHRNARHTAPSHDAPTPVIAPSEEKSEGFGSGIL
jgi:stage V sporulation protein G